MGKPPDQTKDQALDPAPGQATSTAPARLAEEFAPTGPKLSRFPIRPAPPIRQQLFADEARFALRLALLAGGAELAAWASIARLQALPAPRAVLLALLALRLLRPLWAKAGTLVPRPLVAFALIGLSLAAQGAALSLPLGPLQIFAALCAGLPALGDLAASCIADSVTVERRSAAFAWIEMGQGLGCALGLCLGSVWPHLAAVWAAAALLGAGLGVFDLHDRGTPRSSWPRRRYLDALGAPLTLRLCLVTLLGGACGTWTLARGASPWALPGLLFALALSARLEPRMRNAANLPQILAGLCVASLAVPPLGVPALGALACSLPAAVSRGVAELERPVASSLLWSSLALGAGLAALAALA